MQKIGTEIEKLPPVLTVARVADIMGTSRRHVRDLVKQKKLRTTKQQLGNGRLYFDTTEVLKALGVQVEG